MPTLPVARRATAVLIGGLLTVAANLPPEHGHPYVPGHAAIVHRHASLHVTAGPQHHPRLSDNDGLIIWIDGSYLSGAAATLGQPDLALPEPLPRPPVTVAQRLPFERQGTSIHGPPGRPSSSRAPPFFPCL